MKTYRITSKDIDKDGFYSGKTDLNDYQGHIESDEKLGRIRFKKGLLAKGRILFRAGSGISAGCGISAGYGISAGHGISAGSGISAGFSIECKILSSGLRIFAGVCGWRKPDEDETKIKCEELEKGEVCFGELIIVESKKDSASDVEKCQEQDYVLISGVRYELVKKEAA